MSSLFGTGGAAAGANPSTGGITAATSREGGATNSLTSSNTGAGLSGTGSGIGPATFLTRPNSTDGRTSLFGAAISSAGQSAGGSAQAVGDGGNKPGGSLFGGSLFGNPSGGLGGPAGVPSTSSLFSGQSAFTSSHSTAGGGLFGSAGNKPFSLLGSGSSTSSTANTTGAGSSAAPSQLSAGRPDPLFSTLSSASVSMPNASAFGAGKNAETGQPASSATFFGSAGDAGRQTGTSQGGSAPQADNPVLPVAGKCHSFLPSSGTDPKTGFLSVPSGGLFASSGTGSTNTGLSDANKTSGGAAQSGTSTAATSSGAGATSASQETAVAGVVGGTSASLSTGNSADSLSGKPNLPSVSSSAPQTYERDGGQNLRSTDAAATTLQSVSPETSVPSSAASILPRPREVALETLQHELLEEVLAKWERRLDRRVEQFIAVAEEVDTVEKAMIEESRKIQQLMNEQARLERKQVYTAGLIDSLEHQQQDLLTLLRSIESAVLELRTGETADISSAVKDTTYIPKTVAAQSREAGVWHRLLKGTGEEVGDTELIGSLGEQGSSRRPLGQMFGDSNTISPAMPLLSSPEQLALERLRNFDEQLAEVGQSLSYAAETFQAGPLGAMAQVLAVHQAALRVAARQAAHIEERMHQLQGAWEVSKGRPGGKVAS